MKAKHPIIAFLTMSGLALALLYGCGGTTLKPDDPDPQQKEDPIIPDDPDNPDTPDTPDDPSGYPECILQLDRYSYETPVNGADFYIDITADVPWSVTPGRTDWFTVSRTRGSADGDLHVVVEANPLTKPRQDSIVVYRTADPTRREVFHLSQRFLGQGEEKVEAHIDLRVTDDTGILALEWDAVDWAHGYVVKAFNPDGEQVGSMEVTGTSCDAAAIPEFLATSAKQYIGPVCFSVEGLFFNEESSATSDRTAIYHSHFYMGCPDGTSASDPILISTPRQLANVGAVPEGHFKLACDIDLSVVANFVPIASFRGVFEGNGHTVSNLRIVRETGAALFSELAGSGIIRGLNMKDPSVRATSTSVENMAAAVLSFHNADKKGGVFDCHTTGGSISGNYKYVGGIVGATGTSNYAVIDRCSNDGTAVSGTPNCNCVAGLVGMCQGKGLITDSYNRATIEGYGITGGLLGGINAGLTARHCWNEGDVTNLSTSETEGVFAGEGDRTAGGVVARIFQGGGTLEQCWNTGTLSGAYVIGGITGKLGCIAAALKNCYNQGNFVVTEVIEAYTTIGGIAANIASNENVTSTVDCCYTAFTLTMPEGASVTSRMGGLFATKNTDNNTNYPAVLTKRVTNSFYDSTRAPLKPFTQFPSQISEASKTTAQMKSAATYSAWDASIWNIVDGQYPTLK